MRFDPYRELDRWTQFSGGARNTAMAMAAYRSGDRFIVQFDLPGVDPNSVDLTVEKNVLTVRAERSFQPSEGQDVLINERQEGTFTRQIFLGDALDTDHIQATYENGVLTVVIPVAEQAKPRKVEVAAADGSAAQIAANASPSTSSQGNSAQTANAGQSAA